MRCWATRCGRCGEEVVDGQCEGCGAKTETQVRAAAQGEMTRDPVAATGSDTHGGRTERENARRRKRIWPEATWEDSGTCAKCGAKNVPTMDGVCGRCADRDANVPEQDPQRPVSVDDGRPIPTHPRR